MNNIKFPKVLFLGIDAMMPEALFGHIDRFPNIKRLCDNGAWGDYDAYTYGYGSRDNWVSIYTGLTPTEHGVRRNRFIETNRIPRSIDYAQHQPFWQVLNDNGISVGLWRGIVTSPPVPVNGYMFCAEPQTYRWAGRPTHVEFSSLPAHAHLLAPVNGKLPMPPFPPTVESFGFDWNTFMANPAEYEHVITDDLFREGVAYFREETAFFTENIIRVQSENPVDVLFYYTSILDLVQHFQVHEKNSEQILRCLDALDDAVGRLVSHLHPEYVIILSDHGTESFGSLFPDMPLEVKREAFGLRDRAAWLSDGNIVIPAGNGSFLMGAHALKGAIVMSGHDIALNRPIERMRTVDFYPTFLELLGIEVPEGRSGYVLDVFDRPLVNDHRRLPAPRFEEIAILQTDEVARTGDVINAVFLENRFSNITVFGLEKYRNAFLKNGRVSHFVPLVEGVASLSQLDAYDRVIVGNTNPFDTQTPYITIGRE